MIPFRPTNASCCRVFLVCIFKIATDSVYTRNSILSVKIQWSLVNIVLFQKCNAAAPPFGTFSSPRIDTELSPLTALNDWLVPAQWVCGWLWSFAEEQRCLSSPSGEMRRTISLLSFPKQLGLQRPCHRFRGAVLPQRCTRLWINPETSLRVQGWTTARLCMQKLWGLPNLRHLLR